MNSYALVGEPVRAVGEWTQGRSQGTTVSASGHHNAGHPFVIPVVTLGVK